MKRGDLGLAIQNDRYTVADARKGCCITATVVLGSRVIEDSQSPMDDPYTLAGAKLQVDWTDINTLWMVWDYLMAPTRSIPVSTEDVPVRDRVKAILDRLVAAGAVYAPLTYDD